MADTVDRIFLSRSMDERIKHQFVLSGIKAPLGNIILRLFILSFLFGILAFLALVVIFEVMKGVDNTVLFGIIYFILSVIGVFVFFFVIFYMYVSVKKTTRKNQIEDLLGDYLLLVSSNVSAGMTIDQALWYAVRRRFGILAEEMEIVVKKTMSGTKLDDALVEFTQKYDSDMLKKTFVLLIEGMQSGGEISELINKISWNVKENQIVKKEIGSSVASYGIFVVFAAVVAAPLLFALSQKIIQIMAELTSSLDLTAISSVDTKLPISSGGGGLDILDFKRFATTSLFIISFFAALIVSSVKTGNVKNGFKNIPIYITISFGLYLLSLIILKGFFKGIV